MNQGTVKWFNMKKGYGFIEPAEGGSDVFVHITAVQEAGIPPLTDGQKINYELTEIRGKMAAGSLQTVD